MIWDVATDSVVVEAAVVTGPAKVTADVVLVSPLVVEISAVVLLVVLDAVEVVASSSGCGCCFRKGPWKSNCCKRC